MPKIDIAKRRRIMQRSQKLGHCICDPRRPCPCDVFTDRGICPCAGERPDPSPPDQIRLTEMVHNAGCASKIAPGDLEAVLSRLPAVSDPAVISGIPAGDDAAIYRLSDEVLLVQTVDVMTPCVDDPYTFGRICAANCLSDIYAMGGVPRTALSILAFPAETLDGQIMYRMMKGAMEVLAEAGCSLVGGHSIKDEEIKLGFAVTGTIDADKLARHDTARVGDVLVLTKPLGVGVLSFARQIGRDYGGDFGAVERSMAALNRPAAEAMNEVSASACTDITGFGLFGHLVSMVRHSGVTAEMWAGALPAFPGALEAIRDAVIPGAIERNAEYVGEDLAVQDGVDQARVSLGFDAQTSGGLLISVPAERHRRLLEALGKRGVEGVTIGRITEASTGKIVVAPTGDLPADKIVAAPAAELPRGGVASATPACSQETQTMARKDESPSEPGPKEEPHSEECCADVFGAKKAQGTADGGGGLSADAAAALGALLRATGAPGKIDRKTKELINFALVVLARCGPCVEAHLEKARKMGISRAELDEAAWCAVAMGGAPIRMFYEEILERTEEGGEGKCCS
jgi:selenide,water dikinase